MANVADSWLRVGLVLALSMATRAASADSTSVAEALFQDGRRLMKDGDYRAACPKLAESYRLDAAGGTLINLAVCHEHEGKTATAWREFNDAIAQAVRDGRQDRIDEATKRAAALEPDLPKLKLVVPADHPARLEVRLDGTLLRSASWGVWIPVDPGEHVVTASAPGYASWTGRASAKPRAKDEIVVPTLAVRKEAKPTTRPAATRQKRRAEPSSSGPTTAAWVLAGVGVTAVGVGSYFGLVARSKQKDSEGECRASTCTPRGASLLKDADRAAWIANGGFAVGVGSLAVATYLFVTASPAKSEALRVGPQVGARTLALGASGDW